MEKKDKKNAKKEVKDTSKRTKEMREEHLVEIAMLAVENPLTAKNLNSFILLVCKTLNLRKHQARRDILELRKREKTAIHLNSKIELSKKLDEFALIKEKALKQKNLNAYLGAVKAEVQLLGLEKLNIFAKKEKQEVDSLEEKKELFLKMIEEQE